MSQPAKKVEEKKEWIPINKKHGTEYPPISDEEKKEREAYPSLSVNGIHKYTYQRVKEAPKPKESKTVKK